MKAKPLAERFWAKVEKTDWCWHWTAGVDKDGYGRIWVSQKARTRRAHRIAYEMLVGPIPSGLTLDHLCRNPACVNPDHLEPVTNRENILRGNTLQRANALKRECDSGHPFDEANTYVRPNGARTCRICRREYKRRHRIKKRQAAAA